MSYDLCVRVYSHECLEQLEHGGPLLGSTCVPGGAIGRGDAL